MSSIASGTAPPLPQRQLDGAAITRSLVGDPMEALTRQAVKIATANAEMSGGGSDQKVAETPRLDTYA